MCELYVSYMWELFADDLMIMEDNEKLQEAVLVVRVWTSLG